MNIKVFTVLAVLCFLQVSAFLDFRKQSKDLSILTTCAKEKKCALFCITKRLNFTTETGEINIDQIPFFEEFKPYGLENCIAETKDKTDGCEKMNAIRKCMMTSGLKNLRTDSKTCADESGIGDVKLNAANLLKLVMNPKSFKCYIRCMLVKIGLLNTDNTLKLETFEKVMAERNFAAGAAVQLVKSCQEKNAKGDQCNVISGLVVCVGKEAYKTMGLQNLMQFKSLLEF